MKKEISKEFLNNMDSYTKGIKTIELFVDSVRQNPGEYLSSIGNEGWMNGIREVIQNGTDEIQRGFATEVWVEYDERTRGCIVRDNGRGCPVDDLVRIFSREHTSTNYTKEKGNYPSGLHGVGAKCTNAVSSKFEVESYTYNKKDGFVTGFIEFSEGKPLPKYKKGPEKKPNKNQDHGTIVRFIPDFSIMGNITIRCEDVLMFLENLVPLLKQGAKIDFIGHKPKPNGKELIIHKELTNVDGTLTYLIRMTKKPMIKPIMIYQDTGVMKADIAMVFTPDFNAGPNIVTFANMTPVNTIESTPSKGFMRGVQDFFKTYMNKIYLATTRSKLEATNGDVVTGLVAAVSACHMEVMFDGQAKNVCKNEDLEPFIHDVTVEALKQWSKQNPDDLQKVCAFLKDVALARSRADKERNNISKKYNNGDFTKLPKGYVKAENKEHLELFIVEGLSASSPCETARDCRYQAIYAIRGKMPNAFSTTKDKFLANEEVKGIISILGAGYGKNFDISKCPFDKVIILADADPDRINVNCRLTWKHVGL